MEVSRASPSTCLGSDQLTCHNGLIRKKKIHSRCWKSEGITFRHEDWQCVYEMKIDLRGFSSRPDSIYDSFPPCGPWLSCLTSPSLSFFIYKRKIILWLLYWITVKISHYILWFKKKIQLLCCQNVEWIIDTKNNRLRL